MFKRISIVLFALLLFPLMSLAASSDKNSQFTEGKQYKIVTPSATIPARLQVPANKVLVVEFFNYGCPWCFHLEPTLEKWLKTKPADVKFERVPVVFERGWQVYAKAYYAAKALNKLDTITPNIFNAIHKKGLNLASEPALEKFFLSQGVSKQDFESAYNFSPGIGVELQRAKSLMLAYKVFQIPTIIVDGKYITNAAMAKGSDKTLMHVVEFLVKKAQAEKAAAKAKS